MNSGLLRFKYCIHRRVAENAEMLFFAFAAESENANQLCVLRVSSAAGGEII